MTRALRPRSRRLTLLAIVVVSAFAVTTAATVTGMGRAAPAAAPNNTSPPTISGTAEVGKTLTAARGTWTGTDPITYTYQWRRCDNDGGSCSNISGADANTYVLKTVDADNTLRVTVMGKNTDGSDSATSVPSAVVKGAPAPAPSNGCAKQPSNGTVQVADISSPARLVVDQSQISPSAITFDTSTLSVRFHVSGCGGSVQGALVYVTAVPYNQFSVPNEQQTGADGWASLDMHRLSGYPATPKQQLLVMFVRARKSGEPTLTGISNRRLISFRVTR